MLKCHKGVCVCVCVNTQSHNAKRTFILCVDEMNDALLDEMFNVVFNVLLFLSFVSRNNKNSTKLLRNMLQTTKVD